MRVIIAAAPEIAPLGAEVRRLLEGDGRYLLVSLADWQEGSDRPDDGGHAFAAAAAREVACGAADRAVLIDPTGIGPLIAANRVRGVRAALARTPLEAEAARRQFDANVLCLGESTCDLGRLLSVWLESSFEGTATGRLSRHARRVAKIAALEDGLAPRESQGHDVAAAPGHGGAAPLTVPV